jgi:hypothetical protein
MAGDFSTLAHPDTSRHGQLRRAFCGWQWRWSVRGEVFSPWVFTFTHRRALQKLSRLRLELIEEEPNTGRS